MPETKQFYYFTLTKYALEAVRNRQLKATELNKANDPYEMLPFQLNDGNDNVIAQRVRDDFSKFFKMVCFSETYKNPSLWGHYADKCKGVCLGFDIEIYKDNEDIDPVLNIRKVKYKKNRSDMHEFGFDNSSGMPVNTKGKTYTIFYVKSHHWEHEKEWRLLDFSENLILNPITGLYFFPFADRLRLREILIGFRCEEENMEHRFKRLIDTDKYPDPKPEIISTRLSRSTFEIEKAT